MENKIIIMKTVRTWISDNGTALFYMTETTILTHYLHHNWANKPAEGH